MDYNASLKDMRHRESNVLTFEIVWPSFSGPLSRSGISCIEAHQLSFFFFPNLHVPTSLSGLNFALLSLLSAVGPRNVLTLICSSATKQYCVKY